MSVLHSTRMHNRILQSQLQQLEADHEVYIIIIKIFIFDN